MHRTRKIIPILLLAGLLASCGRAEGTSTTDGKKDDWEKAPVQLTQVRTPTPILPADRIPMRDVPTAPPQGNHGGNQGGNPAEQGNGAPLEGYFQLLPYIDRGSVSGPDGWERHPVIDMLDGLFETTDEGSNKYGQNLPSAEVTWEMTRLVTVSAYTIYTANDADKHPERNPQNWTLYGSADGKRWTAIHSVQDANLPLTNYTPTVYEFENTEAYRYYRWSLESTVGGGSFQLSELLLYTKENPDDQVPPLDGGNEWVEKLPAFGQADSGRDATPLTGNDAANWMASHTILTNLVDLRSVATTASCWADNEGADCLFDGVYTAEDFEQAGGGKMGGGMSKGYIVWQMEEAVAPSGYVLVTGNDTSEYPDRNPNSWVLYGGTEDGDWMVLDSVKKGNLEGLDFAAHVYTIENVQSCTQFCLAIEDANGAMQLCELILCD